MKGLCKVADRAFLHSTASCQGQGMPAEQGQRGDQANAGPGVFEVKDSIFTVMKCTIAPVDNNPVRIYFYGNSQHPECVHREQGVFCIQGIENR
jgi:hypothetical protein